MSCTNPTAFSAFEAEERGKALKYTAAWVGADAAQDVVQDGLLVVWQKWDTLTNPAGYLYRTCKQLAFGEYEVRDRGPALLASLPEQPYLDDDDQDEPPMGAAMLNLAVELTEQKWSSPHTIAVGLNLAEGYSRAEIAQFLQLPLSEVHRAARELRRYFKARRTDPEPIGSQNAYTPHGLVMRAMRRLSRREREVMALAALGLKPHLIAPLIGITGGSARTTLCHARKSVASSIGLPTDEGTPDFVDHFIRSTLPTAELLHMLPNTPWKAEALQRTVVPDKGFGWSRLSILNMVHDPKFLAGPHLGDDLVWSRNIAAKLTDFRYRQQGVVPYLTEISAVITVVRAGLEAPGPVAAYGSIRWNHPGLHPRYWDCNRLVPAAAFGRLQATHTPYLLSDPIPAGCKKAAAGTSAYSCPIPSWPAQPPQYLTLASSLDRDSRFQRAFVSSLLRVKCWDMNAPRMNVPETLKSINSWVMAQPEFAMAA